MVSNTINYNCCSQKQRIPKLIGNRCRALSMVCCCMFDFGLFYCIWLLGLALDVVAGFRVFLIITLYCIREIVFLLYENVVKYKKKLSPLKLLVIVIFGTQNDRANKCVLTHMHHRPITQHKNIDEDITIVKN